MKIRVLDTRHFGTMFGKPIFLAESEMEALDGCPVCGDTAHQDVVAQSEGSQSRGLALSQCRSCGHGYLSRRPSANWYQRYYSNDWDTGRVTSKSISGGLKENIVQSLRKITVLRRLYRGLREVISPPDYTHSLERENLITMLTGIGNARGMKFLPRGSRVLEIGCGYGGALAIFKEIGFKAIGTEASPHRVAFCRDRGMNVVETSIEDISMVAAHGPFDVIYSSHVFEHILDISGLMTQLGGLVAEHGYIYIEVPNSSVAEGLGKFLHYPYHCHVFSAASLTRLLERYGFRTVRLKMDVNLQVIACKGVEAFDFPPFPPQSSVMGLLRGGGTWTSEKGPLRMFFDDFDVRIQREDDGRVVYQRSRPYATKTRMEGEVPILGRDFIVEVEDAAETQPVRWVHSTPQAPIWMKFQ